LSNLIYRADTTTGSVTLALEMNNFCREHGLRNGIEFDFATYVTDDAVEFVFYVDTPIATFLALKYNNYL
jgi:hypothetical protein